MARRERSGRAENDERISALSSIIGKDSAFRPAREILKRVRAVPTIFPDVDRKLRVGGWPIERLATIHGPSSEGKTSFLHGLGLSFLQRGHFYVHVDAERTTPITWMESLFGQFADSPLFLAYRPPSFEETSDAVRAFLTTLAAARAKGKVPKDTTALIGIDSLRKLVPKDFLKKVAKEGVAKSSQKSGVDGMKGMGAAIKAKLNAAWIDELTPLLDDTMSSMIFVGREMENTEGGEWDPDWKLGGGKAVYFDSSITARIERKWVYGPGEKDERKPVYGERHGVAIRKTKVAGKEEKVVHAFFHTSNGVLVPPGFDRARDVVCVARDLDVLKGDGWLSWNRRRWNGEHAATKFLTANPLVLAELEECCRARFEIEGGRIVDGDGVVT